MASFTASASCSTVSVARPALLLKPTVAVSAPVLEYHWSQFHTINDRQLIHYHSTCGVCPFHQPACCCAEVSPNDVWRITGHRLLERYGMTEEYWNLPQVTKESFTKDEYFKTGDAGRVDEDGYYVILGRTSADIMKVGGYKFSALEIESTLLEHPKVAECCVMGLPDKDYGEAVTAIIVADKTGAKRKREDESKPVMTLEELCGCAKDKLALYKLPTRLLIWER